MPNWGGAWNLSTEVEAVIDPRLLIYVDEDFTCGFSLAPANFLNLKPKSRIPIIEFRNPQNPQVTSLKR